MCAAGGGGHDECIYFLISEGDNVNKENRYGATALMISAEKGHDICEKIIMLLYAAGETIDETEVQVPGYLKSPYLSQKHLCRETIRQHLIEINMVICLK